MCGGAKPGFSVCGERVVYFLYMKLNEVRQRYVDFMRDRGHKAIGSAPLVPQEDSTTLFTGSGMQPLVPYLLGKEHQQGLRLVNSQKCFRANDIEEVGDNRHTTFFEMLGNWSLGDYFKEEQLEQYFTFLTDTEVGLGLDPQRLYVTAFAGDESIGIPRDEVSAEKWQALFASVGIDAGIAHIGSQEAGDERGIQEGERIFFYDASENWWSRSGEPENMPVGEPGGPDSEVFYDFGEEYTDPAYAHLKPHPASDSGRFLEIGNSVFMEYVRTEDGFAPLPKKNVDFGGGLERMTAATEQVADVFTIDIFSDLLQSLVAASGVSYEEQPEPFRVIADHLRGAVFAIADGVVPSNTDRGYVLRRLIREALYNLRYVLKVEEESLASLSAHFVLVYRDTYPEVETAAVAQVIGEEEEQFAKTLRNGMRELERMLKKKSLDGEAVFMLQSSYGFPKELTVSLAEEKGVAVSLDGYDEAMEKHRALSRQASEEKFKGGLSDTSDMSVKYHTATHLLHQALRDVLGDSVEQKGSNITPERLRFDFSHSEKMTDEQKQQVEEIVNEKIQAALLVSYQDMPIEEARKLGAIGVFSYDDVVRVYSVGDYSKEFCGGPHVDNTSELGKFQIKKEEAVGSGVRRIKAVLG